MTKTLLIPILLVFCSCTKYQTTVTETAKKEILKTEAEFARMAEEEGIAAAFTFFAADSAVLNRGGKIIKGKEAITAYHQAQSLDNIHLVWTPDFVSVSRSGDLGYTYGTYTLSAPDSAGNMAESQGIFHSVWEKQSDGSWKYVWD